MTIDKEIFMEWKYVKPLSSTENINEFESLVKYSLPDEFKNCILCNNGGRPSKKVFDTDTQKERAIKSFLSFNKEDKETVWKIQDWNREDLSGKYVAFAIDNFGNLVCFEINSNKIVFFNHENGKIEQIADNFINFMECLYE